MFGFLNRYKRDFVIVLIAVILILIGALLYLELTQKLLPRFFKKELEGVQPLPQNVIENLTVPESEGEPESLPQETVENLTAPNLQESEKSLPENIIEDLKVPD